MSKNAMTDTTALYELLKKEWHQKRPNMDKCGQLLTQLKVSLTGLSFLPTHETVANKELIISRDVLEIGALYSVAQHDIPSFDRYLAQLKTYYFDYNSHLPESAFKYQLLGLNLLCLLSQNRVADFHTELELLPAKEIQNNVYIRHPVSLEQYLMEGSYNKVFLSKGNPQLLPFAEDKKLLRNVNVLKRRKRNWNINGSVLHFPAVKTVSQTANKIPAEQLAQQIIDYAKELEMIV
ncbi:unnamed protein product [Oppiella nova]|uniref:26S proteasome non-ATPase regulatory subunit 8 n=1 Tax=Oppiella nova TaxID=334625 RepID=A0A7R9LS71_9ACAR|nr:unnamed protein product [Oppiella nova]CAG2166456.1 unnamed protein product [Oppiella nova]